MTETHKALDAAHKDDDARQAAIDAYADTEVEIDLDAEVKHASGGAWVAAWVWVSTEEIADTERCDIHQTWHNINTAAARYFHQYR